ncbi:hypothetical protein LCGC14_1799640 [marine sediment metagenome]|uniref:Cytochrome b561 bacterial/Ni-hydrogenase domain-containing protein n=1 Tax=marine sediment metagenome TaxID=412755 RepID=A0A0F9HCR4_9ZZZZ|tara:strand:- start:6188 stop:6829 length:642 start_codon:yes stop_codon:yes gene_type:complete
MREQINLYRQSLVHMGRLAGTHHLTTRVLHWSLAALLVYGLIFPAEINALSDPIALRVEVAYALTVAVLFGVRLIYAVTCGGGSRLPSDAPMWEHLVSLLVQFGIYTAILAIAITGIVIALTSDAAQIAFGFSMPSWPFMLPQTAVLMVHRYLAEGLNFLIILHILGALWHFLVRRDGVWQSIFWRRDWGRTNANPTTAVHLFRRFGSTVGKE